MYRLCVLFLITKTKVCRWCIMPTACVLLNVTSVTRIRMLLLAVGWLSVLLSVCPTFTAVANELVLMEVYRVQCNTSCVTQTWYDKALLWILAYFCKTCIFVLVYMTLFELHWYLSVNVFWDFYCCHNSAKYKQFTFCMRHIVLARVFAYCDYFIALDAKGLVCAKVYR